MCAETEQQLSLPREVNDFLLQTIPQGAKIRQGLPLAGDASDRKYFRIFLEPSAADEQDSYILMQLEKSWIPEKQKKEIPFINIAKHMADKGLSVPVVYKDASEDGFILLEDVGDITFQNYLEYCSLDERRKRYRQAVDILVQMQKKATENSGSSCYALNYAFDPQTFFNELCFFRKHALEGLWGHKIHDAEREKLDSHFWDLCREICTYPQVFTHRDYHSRNLMVHGDRLVVLDFQDARMGPFTYDLVSLVRDSYICLIPDEQDDIVAYYREIAGREDIKFLDAEEFRRAFNRTALQRNLKAIGTFAYQTVIKGADRYLESIPNTVQSVHLALESDRGLVPLKQILNTYLQPIDK